MAQVGDLLRKAYIDPIIGRQASSGKTRASRISDCLLALVASAVVIALVIGWRLFLAANPSLAESLGGAGGMLGTVGIIVLVVGVVVSPLVFILSLVLIIIYGITPAKTVACPFCGASHRVFARVTSYVCDRCGGLLLMGGQHPAGPLFVAACPVCQSQWAASGDLGDTRCPDCGTHVHVEHSQVAVSGRGSPCSSCGNDTPAGAYLCPSCAALQNDPSVGRLAAYTKTDNAFTMMFAGSPEKDRWGYDAITQEYFTDFGLVARGLWLVKRLAASSANGEVDQTRDLGDMLRMIAIANVGTRPFVTPELSAALDHILALYYKTRLTDSNTLRNTFRLKSDIDGWNERYRGWNDLHDSILKNRLDVSRAIESSWPLPVMDLVSDQRITGPGNSITYSARLRNQGQIVAFMAQHGGDVDVDAAIAESVRLFEPLRGQADRDAAPPAVDVSRAGVAAAMPASSVGAAAAAAPTATASVLATLPGAPPSTNAAIGHPIPAPKTAEPGSGMAAPEPSLGFCESCGARRLTVRQAFCTVCGLGLSQPIELEHGPAAVPLAAPGVPAMRRRRPPGLLVVAIGLVAVVALAGGAYLLASSKPAPTPTSSSPVAAGPTAVVAAPTAAATAPSVVVVATAAAATPPPAAPTGAPSPSAAPQANGTFVALAGSLTAPRTGHLATLLDDGRVLIAGGDSTSSDAELYDPEMGSFGRTGAPTDLYWGEATATLLQDGRVLFIDRGAAQLYDPATGAFTASGSMTEETRYTTATLLDDGRVLVTGGETYNLGTVASAELFDPKTGQFGRTGSMLVARTGHTATLLGDGRVLITGGADNMRGVHDLAEAELYDPGTGKFSRTGPMLAARRGGHEALLLPDGRVLVIGGDDASAELVQTVELYDPKTGRFKATASLPDPIDSPTATLLQDGRVLLAGGGDGYGITVYSTAELFLPASGTFSSTGSLVTARTGHSATLLQDGRVLIVGGSTGASGATRSTPLDSAELYQP